MIKKFFLGKSKAILLLYLFPFIIISLFITNFSVNVPYWDQWESVSLFEKVATGKATFLDFFAQHNEHRLFFPKLIFVALAFSSQWNIEYEIYFNVFLATINFLVLYKISTLQKENRRNISWHLTNILTCVAIFSLIQYENWLWGFQIAWFLVITCLLIAILIVALPNFKPRRLYLAAIPCFIASFSSAHGLLTWLAVIPSVICLNGSIRQRITRTVTWILLFLTTCAVYLIDYHKPSHHPSTLFFLKEPFVAAKYFFTLLGAPLKNAIIPASIAGFILFSIFVYLATYFFRKSKQKIQIESTVVAWISIGLFAILFALMTTVGRAGFGVEQAMSSRYTTSAVLLIVSIAQLWQRVYWKKSFLTGMIMAVLLINSADVIPQASSLQLQRQISATCLELVKFMDKSSAHGCLENLYPSTTSLQERAIILEKIGFRKFPNDIDFINETVKVHGYIDSPPTAKTSLPISRKSNLNLAGWAILPDLRELPKVVFFSYDNRKSFFASALVNLDSSDVAKALKSTRYNKVRWSTDLSPKYLPLGAIKLKAWVYNPVKQQFVRLRGEPKLTVMK